MYGVLKNQSVITEFNNFTDLKLYIKNLHNENKFTKLFFGHNSVFFKIQDDYYSIYILSNIEKRTFFLI
jgi:hypothetical protein